MNAFVDAGVILVLLGIALAGGADPLAGGADQLAAGAAGAAGAVVACWLAVVTPALVRSDLSSRRLPNPLTLPAVGLVVTGAPIAWVVTGRGQDPALALFVTGGVALLGLLGTARGGIGLGDVKLGAALAGGTALVDPAALPVFAGVTAASGLVLALVTQRRARHEARSKASLRVSSAAPPGSRGATIPYGPCLLAGYWSGLLASRAPEWATATWLAAGGPLEAWSGAGGAW